MIVQHVSPVCAMGGREFQMPNSPGEIHFRYHASMITLAFEFCPERFSFIGSPTPEHNYFEFKVEPWIAGSLLRQIFTETSPPLPGYSRPRFFVGKFVYEKSDRLSFVFIFIFRSGNVPGFCKRRHQVREGIGMHGQKNGVFPEKHVMAGDIRRGGLHFPVPGR